MTSRAFVTNHCATGHDGKHQGTLEAPSVNLVVLKVDTLRDAVRACRHSTEQNSSKEAQLLLLFYYRYFPTTTLAASSAGGLVAGRNKVSPLYLKSSTVETVVANL